MNILADASLPGLDAAFPSPFKITTYTNTAEIPSLLAEQDVLLCRSTLKVTADLLQNHSLKFLATASSGTDHLDHNFLKANKIKIIDAKGANATSVADYVMATLAYLDQKQLITGPKLGIIGMGYVGTAVRERLGATQFQISAYDPLKENFQTCDLEELFDCNVLCIHAELHCSHPHPSFNLVNQFFLSHLKPGCIIINAARGGIVDETALLNNTNSLIYCTDVYLNEPRINKDIIQKTLICTPHIAGHSLDAKYAAVALVSEQLHNLAGLSIPSYAIPELNQTIKLEQNTSWQKKALAIYDPLQETELLKHASNFEAAFLTVRKNHQFRFDSTRF
ncbi:MAG: 4-phosphoerythronate dehydrogenase [Legionella sp.]|jgi:erythronate-4-phosphate dehydrogenase